jgi:hypothetical protein
MFVSSEHAPVASRDQQLGGLGLLYCQQNPIIAFQTDGRSVHGNSLLGVFRLKDVTIGRKGAARVIVLWVRER